MNTIYYSLAGMAALIAIALLVTYLENRRKRRGKIELRIFYKKLEITPGWFIDSIQKLSRVKTKRAGLKLPRTKLSEFQDNINIPGV